MKPVVSKAPRGTDRTRDVAEAAVACFRRGGYRLTQIVHVSERLGVSVGTIYRYVESKEALLYLAVLEAAGRLPEQLALPVKVKGVAAALAVVRSEFDSAAWPVLAKALNTARAADPHAEAEAVAAELYDAVYDKARLIDLVDRCAHDIPELADAFDRRVRGRLIQDLEAWVARRGRLAGGLAEATARGAMEGVVWLARNRRDDRTASAIGDEAARAAAIRIFANALAV